MENYPKVDDKIVFREEGDEAFLFNSDTGDIKILNSTGMFIWKLCDGKHAMKEIADTIIEEFDTPSREEVEKDLGKFIKNLGDYNFINA